MRVCVFASTYPRFPGDGAGRFVQSISEALVPLGHQVHVLAPFHPSVSPIEGPVQVHHFRYVRPDSLAIMGYAQAMQSDRQLRPQAYPLAPLFFASGLLALIRLTARYRFDVIHAHWVIPNAPMAALVARARRIPLVVSLHGSDIFVAQSNRFFGALARRIFAQAAGITACSPELLEGALALGAPSERAYLIPWGADPAVFARAYDTKDLRTRWALGPNEPIVLGLARLVRKKGYQYLIRAIPSILSTHPTAQFMIVGEGPEKETLQRLATELQVNENVVFTGEARWDEVPRYLQLGDIFVAPSIHDERGNVDGQPTAILEAMAAGKPIVASDLAGIPLVVSDEKTGLLVQERNPQQLAEAITRLLDSPALSAQFGQASQDRVKTELNWHQVAVKFSAIYTQEPAVVGNQGTRGAQTHPRQNSSAMEDPRYAPRSRQANKILAILKDFLGSDISDLKCLDIGCGTGAISNRLAADFGLLVGLDIDLDATRTTITNRQDNSLFAVADGARIPVPDGCFDIVICAQVYEHAADQRALAKEIWRVLRSGGICFFSGPNRLAVMEEHYWLPLLSWLPGPISDRYMRLLGRGSHYDIKPLFYWQLRQLWQPFIILDYTVELIQNPERFGMAEKLGRLGWISRLPRWPVKMLIHFFPNYNWILMKHNDIAGF